MLESSKGILNDENISNVLERYGYPKVAIGYGSGFFEQEGNRFVEGEGLRDLIFGVDNTFEFHKKNFEQNSKDYWALIRLLGPKFANYLQKFGVHIYYNPYIDTEIGMVKYGVISTLEMNSDLSSWNSLYVAGRLHKPVKIYSSDKNFNEAYERNLLHAVNVASILQSDKFLEEDLYRTIIGISFMGDIRSNGFENPDKVSNILKGQFEKMRELYKDIIPQSKIIKRDSVNENIFIKDNSEAKMYETLSSLPKNLQNAIVTKDSNIIENLARYVKKAIKEIVETSAKSQTKLGLFTAGPARSAHYVLAKMKKYNRK